MRICLVTAEFHGLFKNGGIGTANTGLALELAAAGHEVTVAYVDPGGWFVLPTSEAFLAARAHWRERGIYLDVVPRWARLKASVEDFCWSLSVLEYLRPRGFDTVLFNECGGQGYYSLLAKRAGVFADSPYMIVVTHGASEWARDLNGQLPLGYRAAGLAFCERRSVELADLVASPSRYLVNWMRERGWRLPERVEIVQNIVPVSILGDPPASRASLDEIVFFGRLEARKGVEIFCDAIEALEREGKLGEAGVTFLGKFSRVGGVHSGVFLMERSRGWRVRPRILAHLDQQEALDYLKRPGALAVMPSLAENSPCVVVECLLGGVPFVASNVGGAVELVAGADAAECLVAPNATALAAKVAGALAQGQPRGRMARAQADTRARWRALVESPPVPPPAQAMSRVSVCITVPFGAGIEPLALAAIAAQTHPDVELIVVAYGANEDRREDSVGEIRLFRRSRDRAAARNAAAASARGEWLAFVRERDLMLEPHALATLVAAAGRLQAQAVSGFAFEHTRPGRPTPDWDGELGVAPLGPCLPLAALENCLGDDVFIISTGAFAALGGYESGVGVAIENQHLLTRALAQGVAVDLAPTLLAWRRMGPTGRGDEVADLRAILQVFAGTPLGVFAPALESLLSQGTNPARAQTAARLAGLDSPSRELALALSFDFAVGAPDSFPTFVRYCLARLRFVEALDFARAHDPQTLTPLVEAAMAREGERGSRLTPRATPPATKVSLSLSLELDARLRLHFAPEGALLTRDAQSVASLRLPLGMTIAKAPLACPPGTQTLAAAVDFAAAGALEVEVALLVAEPLAQMVLTDAGPDPATGVWWSGWRPAARERIGLLLDGLPASATALDIYLLGRNATSDEVWAVWRDITAQGSVSALLTPGALHPAESRHKLPLHVLERGELLTDASDFPYRSWIPGAPALHHPLAGRVSVVRTPAAVPGGSVGVAASFQISSEHAHPVAFAFWLHPAGEIDPACAEPPANVEWTICAQPFEARRAELRLDRPVMGPHDLYLATKVVGFDDVIWCHAHWLEIAVIEAVRV